MKYLIPGAICRTTNQFTLPNNANKKDNYICIDCNKDVILRKGEHNIAHFSHTIYDKCDTYSLESEIHKKCKKIIRDLLISKVYFIINSKCNKCNENNIVLEYKFDNTYHNITIEYSFYYNKSANPYRADICVTDKYDNILYIFEICKTNKTIESHRPEPWYEFDVNDIINSYNNIKDNIFEINCIRNRCCPKCETKIENIGLIYFNQRGAGCGKTYESIQLLQNHEQFVNKRCYIYLTKQHTAKDVILNELLEQYENKKLDRLELKYKDISSKQYKLKFFNNNLNSNIEVIIGTIDSFNYAIVDKNKIQNSNDYFYEIVKTINRGHFILDNVKYATKNIIMNKECLIIIDEAQDLTKEYIISFQKIIEYTKIDVYVIGDKLQSILGKNNIYTYLENIDDNETILKSNGVNDVKRFHNIHFKDFVNKIVPFNKYNLPEITNICNNTNCKYTHENDIIPYTIFQIPSKINTLYDDITIEKIIYYMNNEIDKYNYLPHNFMFIFPVFTNNTFADYLHTILQFFWMDKFKNEDYQKNVLLKNTYWKDKLPTINYNYTKYVFLHKSNEGQSINLKDSEYATRILSIHASKGNGCEVVFVLGVSEFSLKLFSIDKNDLVYDSLLHVALTRQKKSLYIGLEYNNDDIHNRLIDFIDTTNSKNDNRIEPNLNIISKYNKYDKLVQNVKIKETLLDNKDFIEVIKYHENKIKFENEDRSNKDIVDMGHHLIRYCVMYIKFIFHIYNNINNTNDDIFYENVLPNIIKQLSKIKIEYYSINEYKKQIKILSEKFKPPYDKITMIPILSFENTNNESYSNCTKILKNMYIKLQNKLKKKYYNFCCLESVLLCYLIHLYRNDNIMSMMDLYDIVYSFETFNISHSNLYDCLCDKEFSNIIHKDNKFSINIREHYNNITKIDDLYNNYIDYIDTHYSIKKNDIKYNINQSIYYNKKNDNINIRNNFKIIGYSDKYVFVIYIKPTLSKLNLIDTIYEIILNNNILQYTSVTNEIKNPNKFVNKKIINCIFTLDCDKPFIFDYDNYNIDNIIKPLIYNFIEEKYINYNKLIYNYKEYIQPIWKENKQNKKLMEYVNEGIKNYRNIPEYICRTLLNIKDKGNIIKNQELFIEELNKTLKCEMDNLFYINCTEIEDDF